MTITPRAMGVAVDRFDGAAKVRGEARYAYEQPVDRPLYLYPLTAAVATGRIADIDCGAASAEPGVVAVLTYRNATRTAAIEDGELRILQSDEVAFRGQFIGGVVAETSEIARHAVSLVRVDYEERPHDVELREGRGDLRVPREVQPIFPMDTAEGDVDAALASAPVRVDQTYTTAWNNHNPIEPHTTIATWTGDRFTFYLSTQGVNGIQAAVAALFELGPDRVRVISPYVGGAFGSKARPHADVVLAALAARLVPDRPVKFALTRQQMFSQVGYRPPTVQRVRLGADAGGRLVALAHESIEPTSKLQEFAEHSTRATPTMYAAPNRRTRQRLAALDVPTPTIMRAPGEASGMFALESAMDEMAIACGLDPIEFRIRNDAQRHPHFGLPFSSRNLVACLREGARRFGWDGRDPTPGIRRTAGWLVGTGVAAATYPVLRLPGSMATIRVGPDERYTVLIAAADIGTGTWTALSQVAADALGVRVEQIDLRIGDTAYPKASNEGGSSGITSWGSAICEAADRLRDELARHGGAVPADGLEVTAAMPENPHISRYAMHAFGAQFAEVRVHAEIGEVRVRRQLGVFAVGRVVNPKTARSQLLGGMTMGLSMALHEQSVFDPRFAQVVTQDLATYHIASNADVGAVEVHWIDEDDPYVNPMGTKGVGEIGIVGAAAAIANAVHHATGVRVRDLPITLDKLLPAA
ncbi:xanthine dehydrogenase YagR molybdenum-binding subunit [Micromonospora pattaloongensis]|uniref:Xanthine dehydrogenase YagR molybdenum-binding subunit n=1 Tax=Micromonospora pattaloongensis TaxID=405436 RepID=A0A1H3NJU9_9ACTN|nr:xanthine dehydrogenase family protein molybdopterin-binding subunit [Micromonospora pattaloongensis]SDY89206.1 xanthine dehydrogenase YagR molybdenum-binding subunit [Micromonospora pattaloongensis]